MGVSSFNFFLLAVRTGPLDIQAGSMGFGSMPNKGNPFLLRKIADAVTFWADQMRGRGGLIFIAIVGFFLNAQDPYLFPFVQEGETCIHRREGNGRELPANVMADRIHREVILVSPQVVQDRFAL
jgi:hypothetical protein